MSIGMASSSTDMSAVYENKSATARHLSIEAISHYGDFVAKFAELHLEYKVPSTILSCDQCREEHVCCCRTARRRDEISHPTSVVAAAVLVAEERVWREKRTTSPGCS